MGSKRVLAADDGRARHDERPIALVRDVTRHGRGTDARRRVEARDDRRRLRRERRDADVVAEGVSQRHRANTRRRVRRGWGCAAALHDARTRAGRTGRDGDGRAVVPRRDPPAVAVARRPVGGFRANLGDDGVRAGDVGSQLESHAAALRPLRRDGRLERRPTAAAAAAVSRLSADPSIRFTAEAGFSFAAEGGTKPMRDAPTDVTDARSCAPVRRAAAAAASLASPRTRRPHLRTNSAHLLALGRLPTGPVSCSNFSSKLRSTLRKSPRRRPSCL
mmetsp:Transcript_6388/g.24703  ORF Transcript_6388/g.24703 Transcript_6388/m.24703 type:complete len:276 (-) Transcript_6388:5237-6064(-)